MARYDPQTPPGGHAGRFVPVKSQEQQSVLMLHRVGELLIRQRTMLVNEKISEMDSQIHAWHRSNELSRRLETIPGIGPITASAIAATVADATLFKPGRQLAAWIGLVLRQNSSGGKDRLGRISKQGDPYLRRLLVVGAHAVLRFSGKGKAASTRWAAELLAKKP
ncbi:transposase [Mesorhizobium sangaii]|uniref:Transposase n=1 Tax=Mesorhizobium sangaii TaxID=505389 RepID=A0A841PK56_9HYPH|nr:transposase [Mesorhizobium sangaii]